MAMGPSQKGALKTDIYVLPDLDFNQREDERQRGAHRKYTCRQVSFYFVGVNLNFNFKRLIFKNIEGRSG